MRKETSLAVFTRRGLGTSLQQQPGITPSKYVTTTRRRGKGDIVALTVRLPRAEWERVHQLAVAEGVSIQALAVTGLSRVFTDKGLPALNE
jgi:hypothetical protein